jgi:hypothetical protein
MVVTVTWAGTGVDPAVTILGDTVQVDCAGSPLQLSDTVGANSLTAARSTVKIAVCPGTTVRLVQVVVSTLCDVPVMGTVWGLPGALSATPSDAVALPPAVGVNVTWMVQLLSGASDEGQLLVCPNSFAFGPVNPIEVMVSVALPLLVSVTGRVALAPAS